MRTVQRFVVPLIMLGIGLAVGYFVLGSVATGRAAPPSEPALQFQCGNGICEPTENKNNCPEDCGSGGDSGGDDGGGCNNDGICQLESGETTVNCGDCPSVCGDNICAPHEVDSCCGEGFDCTVAITCGDGICSACESFQNCPTDCQPTATPVRIAPPTPTPTLTATPEPEETEEPQATEEPTDEPPPPPPPTEAVTPQTAYDYQDAPPPDGQDCYDLFGLQVCVAAITLFGVTIVCCVSAGGIVAVAMWTAQRGGTRPWTGGAGGGGGGGAPQQKVIPPQEGSGGPDPGQRSGDSSAPDQPGGEFRMAHESEVLSQGQGEGGSYNLRGEGRPDLGDTLIEEPPTSSDPGIVGGIIPPLGDKDEDEEDEE